MKITRVPSVGLSWLLVVLFSSTARLSNAQHAGSRAQFMNASNSLEVLTPEVVNSHIMVAGSAQVRVKPTRIRMVWAITKEAEDARRCHTACQETIDAVRARLAELGIEPANMVEDFISAIPRYEYLLEAKGDERVVAETRTGFRMQTNLHVAVKSDAKALEVMEALFGAGVSDLIAVDYSADIEEVKAQALSQALVASRAKARLLFDELYDTAPKVINVREQSAVFYPDDLYDSFENVASPTVAYGRRDGLRHIQAFHPKNTYYRGLTRAADKKSYALSMQPEIVVESKVEVYYQSPEASNETRSAKAP